MRQTLLLLITACAASRPAPHPTTPGSRGPRASDHMTAARDEDERSRAAWPDAHRPDATGRVDQLLVGDAFHGSWDTAADHQQAAAHHRSAALALHDEYERACSDRPYAEISVSPIARHGMGGSTTANGVILYMTADAGPVPRLLADLECHRAWMMLAPANMDHCPLDLDGLLVDARAEEGAYVLTLSVRDPALVPELQRRVAHDLEIGGR